MPAPHARQTMILDAACDLFFQRGFAAVGVDEIGQSAGVTGPAIYRYFESKDEILSALFDDAIDRLLDATTGTNEDPFAELEAMIHGHASFVVSERKLAGVKVREERSLAQPFRRSLHRRERRYIERWTTCVQRCFPDREEADVVTAVHVALGALNSVATWSAEAVRQTGMFEVLVSCALGSLQALGQPEDRQLRSA